MRKQFKQKVRDIEQIRSHIKAKYYRKHGKYLTADCQSTPVVVALCQRTRANRGRLWKSIINFHQGLG